MIPANPQQGEWADGQVYETYVGRWSRPLAGQFLKWLSVPAQAAWLDVGCGTGALSQAILNVADPRSLKGIDRSEAYLKFARSRLVDARVTFDLGDAQSLPVEADAYDAVVSGLMRHFWNAAAALDPGARALDEGRRFPICSPGALRELFDASGLTNVQVMPIDIDTHFKNFDDYWTPFLGGQGPASGYCVSLSEEARERLRERIRDSLPLAIDGSIPLVARAWAVKGIKGSVSGSDPSV
jgi:SAM-dependent methyltransferase